MPEESRLINDGWNTYVRNVYPTLSSDTVQYREMQRAFFAGAHLVNDRAATLSRHGLEEYLIEISAMQNELDQFVSRFQMGA